MRLLLLVSHKVAKGRHEAVQKGECPQADYDGLAEAVRAIPGGQADILDWTSVEEEAGRFIKLVARICGHNWALALLGHQRCHEYDAVFCHGESVALPLAVLFSPHSRRPRHVAIAYYFVGRRYTLWYRFLGATRGVDTIFTLSRSQHARGRQLKIPEDKLVLLDSCGYVDTEFFRTAVPKAVNERQICSTGLEFRDYATLLRAVEQLPDVKLKIDPNSPWSLHRSAVEDGQLPPNVEIVRMKIGASRELYAESEAIVVPLRENSIGAGSTTLVEAMLMGKPVIVSRSKDKTFGGRRDLIDGENVLLVDYGDVFGLRQAIERVTTDRELRRRIGNNAREWARKNAGREQWLDIMLGALRGMPARAHVPIVAGQPSLGIGS